LAFSLLKNQSVMKKIRRIVTINFKMKGGGWEEIIARSEIHEGAGRMVNFYICVGLIVGFAVFYVVKEV